MFMWFKKNATYWVPALLVVSVVLLLPNIAHASACIPFSGGGGFELDECFLEILIVVMNVVALLVGLAGMFLNLVIQYTIIGMKDFVGSLVGINVAWTVLRDLINILFVFILLFIGISTILGSWIQSSFSTKLIPKVILAALLINFSLFFTKAIIDVSNIVTYEFYKATASLNDSQAIPGTNNMKLNMGLAGAFMDGIKATALGSSGSVERDVTMAVQMSSYMDYTLYVTFRVILSILFFFVAAFVFFTIALMLIVRFVILIFLMLTSPIAFVGGLLPQLKPHADAWWKQLSSQAMFAPIFMILALVVILIIRDPNFGTIIQSGPSPTTTGQVAEQTFGALVKVVMQYCIAMFLLITALVAAKQTAGKAGDAFVSWGQKLAGGAVLGGSAFLARQTVGRLGTQMANSEWAGRAMNSRNALIRNTFGAAARGAVLTGDKLRTASFDARGIKAVGGLGLGSAGGKGGLVATQAARAKKLTEHGELYAKSMALAAQKNKVKELEAAVEAARRESRWDDLTKNQKDLTKERSVLSELQGGVRVSEARTELAAATKKLSRAQQEEADGAQSVIEAQKDKISKLELQDKIKPNDPEIQRQLTEERDRLRTFRTTISDEANRYIDAKEQIGKVMKAAGSQTGLAEQRVGAQFADSYNVSTRQASDSLRKGKTKPEDSIAKEMMKMLGQQPQQSGAGGTGTAAATPAGGQGSPLVNPAGQPVNSQGNTVPPANPPSLIIKP